MVFALDREHNDVLLLGLRDPARPPIDLDCLATAIGASTKTKTPICSLDPDSDPRYQITRVAGVPRQSRWAEIMIVGDYRMKEVAQGLKEPQPG